MVRLPPVFNAQAGEGLDAIARQGDALNEAGAATGAGAMEVKHLTLDFTDDPDASLVRRLKLDLLLDPNAVNNTAGLELDSGRFDAKHVPSLEAVQIEALQKIEELRLKQEAQRMELEKYLGLSPQMGFSARAFNGRALVLQDDLTAALAPLPQFRPAAPKPAAPSFFAAPSPFGWN